MQDPPQRRRADLMPSLPQRVVAECLGTAFLLAAVVGSGIMAAKLAGGNGALALLCNTIPTGAILTVLILDLRADIRRAFQSRGQHRAGVAPRIAAGPCGMYIAAQIVGGMVGVLAAHAMFELPLWQVSVTIRTGVGQWFAEGVATSGCC